MSKESIAAKYRRICEKAGKEYLSSYELQLKNKTTRALYFNILKYFGNYRNFKKELNLNN